HSDAWLNLGAMMCEANRCNEALELYDEALRQCPEEPLLYFNRAIALEDQGRLQEAIASYEACLLLAPDFADAHFNAARLHEQAGNAQKAVRHLSAYRRLQRQV
ncbi:MAG TPA: tetratricopeptide repeat protein, partial [Lautropia sp.]|nr:tetratricopeptide repeat protein [Lautropia sp.]